MADVAQVLMLPPPTPYQRLPVREGHELAINEDSVGGEGARARRFRFRVHEGNDGSAASGDTRRAGAQGSVQTALSRSNASAGNSATGSTSGSIRYSSRDPGSGASSTFLAQSIAQEQLGDGLHNPPNAAAAAAYSRAGTALTPRVSVGLDIRT